jgi:hypothetical protein
LIWSSFFLIYRLPPLLSRKIHSNTQTTVLYYNVLQALEVQRRSLHGRKREETKRSVSRPWNAALCTLILDFQHMSITEKAIEERKRK